MAFITIKSKGQEFICQFDARDQELINAHKWYLKLNGKYNYYVCAHIKKNGENTTLHLHRYLLGLEDPDLEIDHIDGNGLNNCRDNLRICTRRENARNKHKYRGSSKYKGVYLYDRCIIAQIKINGKGRHLGMFRTEKGAARAYDKAARQLFGAFACLNFQDATIEAVQLTIF